ncbi:Hsp20/alpha crystallin family protein [Opitutus terrae]|uniref:Heat shock protein Hsp20 n=1 Tax=Opitutus terrae (strain DSM 11246 / JCM 15787 / PB90-1) TaxID=452637 RepID=B1ZWT6_OPITP|nr:Hsp20/alpha crystallin family protein [Opitutus terrae]ACB74213.1 heat shock protein Hsp20 [Opitutus terrae PB90-1]
MALINSLIPTFGRTLARRESTADQNLGPTVKPLYEIKETDDAFGVTVYLPGVAKDGLEITADAAELRIVGRRTWQQPEGWTALYRESSNAAYELVLTHDNAIDADRIAAELRDGVLRVSLPKAEAVKPRKIAVT